MSSELDAPGGSPKAPTQDLLKKFQKARAIAGMCWPFMNAATLRLVLRWSSMVPTMGVDRAWRLYLNPDFVDKQDERQLALLLVAHELQHALGDHAVRLTQYRGEKLSVNGQPVSLANVAHDLAINSSIEAFISSGAAYRKSISGGDIEMKIPENALYAHQFKDAKGKQFPSGLVSEGYAELLSKLPKSESPQGGGQSGGGSSGKGGKSHPGPRDGAGCGKCGSAAGDGDAPWEDRSPPTPGDFDSGVTEAERGLIARQVAQAAVEQEAKSRGTTPGGIQMWAKTLLTPPKVDWRAELRRVVKSGMNWLAGQVDYTYTRPNRRSFGRIILPGMRAPEPKFILVLDFSGSMGPSDYDAMFSEVAAVIRLGGHRRIPVIGCDAAADEIQYVTKVSDIRIVGGGGTDMRVGIESAAEHGARLVICCTDGVTPWPNARIEGLRVIACLTRPESSGYDVPEWIKVVKAYDE